MRLVKVSGRSVSGSRRGTLHGSGSGRRQGKWGGQLQRLGEKPKGGRRPGGRAG